MKNFHIYAILIPLTWCVLFSRELSALPAPVEVDAVIWDAQRHVMDLEVSYIGGCGVHLHQFAIVVLGCEGQGPKLCSLLVLHETQDSCDALKYQLLRVATEQLEQLDLELGDTLQVFGLSMAKPDVVYEVSELLYPDIAR